MKTMKEMLEMNKTKKTITLTLPFPPSVNHYYCQTRRGKYISKKGRIFRSMVETIVYESGMANLAISSPIRIAIYLTRGDKRKYDIDNCVKALQDALQHAGVYTDDSLINELVVIREEPQPKNGKCVVNIEIL